MHCDALSLDTIMIFLYTECDDILKNTGTKRVHIQFSPGKCELMGCYISDEDLQLLQGGAYREHIIAQLKGCK